MRPSSTVSRAWIPLLLSGGIAGCGDGPPAAPDAPGAPDAGPAFTITISSDRPPALVAFRDGLASAWQAATMKTPTTFEAEVHGPYVVTLVCEEVTRGLFRTIQLARTPDDERSLTESCDFTPVTRYAVTGLVVQPGRVQIEDRVATSSTPDWGFNLAVRGGTHDLLALTPDRIALRRAIAVTGNTQLTPPIDLLQEGAALADVAFTATNAAPGETLVASVHLDATGPVTPLNIHRGPIETAKVAPDAVLVATDVQSASIQATAGNVLRALRRPFRVGGDTAYTLPAPPAGVQWDVASGNLTVSWSSLPEFSALSVDASGGSAGAFRNHYLDLSPRFVAATGITSATIDTSIAGYKPEWRVDFARQYNRRLFVQRVASGEISSGSVSETLNIGMFAAQAPAPDLPLAHDRLAPP